MVFELAISPNPCPASAIRGVDEIGLFHHARDAADEAAAKISAIPGITGVTIFQTEEIAVAVYVNGKQTR